VKLARQNGSYTMEAVTLVAVLCIAGVFIFSHMVRQADRQDAQARRFAEKLAPAVEALFAATPEAELTAEALAQAGHPAPAPLRLNVPLDHRAAGDWQVMVWHPEGRKVFVVSAQGVASDFR